MGKKTCKSLFDYVIDPLVDHLKKLLNEPLLMRKCKYLCLVGGLLCSKYLQHKMKTQFGPRLSYKLEIIIPKTPILSVVKGAAYFGLNHDYIKGRVLQRAYGHIISKSETAATVACVPQKHIRKNRYYNRYKQKYYIRLFQIVAYKGGEILYGMVKEGRQFRDTPTTKSILNPIYYSDKVDPLIKSDGRQLATMELTWEDDEDDMEVITEFNFFDTTIRAQTYKVSAPQNKKFEPLNYKD